MTIDELRSEIGACRERADEEARELKDPYIVIERLHAFYKKLNDVERGLADQVVAEWAISGNEGVRFDALALIDDLVIKAAVPVLHVLAVHLESSSVPSGLHELKKSAENYC